MKMRFQMNLARVSLPMFFFIFNELTYFKEIIYDPQ